jgi:hypothetical protein
MGMKFLSFAVLSGGLVVPAHQRGVLSGGLVAPAHAKVGGFGFGGLHVVGWSVWLQHLSSVGSRMAEVLSVRCFLPLVFSIGGGFR